MNHINTLAIDQSQGFVTYLWEDFNQNTMNNKVNEKNTFERVQKGIHEWELTKIYNEMD